MRASNAALALIERFEGFRAAPYHDAAGLLTIGYGHLIGKLEHFTSVTQDQAQELLGADVASAERAVNAYIHTELTQNQFDALVSFTYNLGAGTLQHSTLCRVVNARNFDEVPAAFKAYNRAGGIIQQGLVTRRADEAALFMGA